MNYFDIGDRWKASTFDENREVHVIDDAISYLKQVERRASIYITRTTATQSVLANSVHPHARGSKILAYTTWHSSKRQKHSDKKSGTNSFGDQSFKVYVVWWVKYNNAHTTKDSKEAHWSWNFWNHTATVRRWYNCVMEPAIDPNYPNLIFVHATLFPEKRYDILKVHVCRHLEILYTRAAAVRTRLWEKTAFFIRS